MPARDVPDRRHHQADGEAVRERLPDEVGALQRRAGAEEDQCERADELGARACVGCRPSTLLLSQLPAAGRLAADSRGLGQSPAERAFHGRIPARVPALALLRRRVRVPRRARRARFARSSSSELPEADGEPRRVGGAERGRLDHGRPHDRQPENVGLDLQQQLVGGHAAVDAQRRQLDTGIRDHRVDQLARRVRGRVERGAREVRLRVEAASGRRSRRARRGASAARRGRRRPARSRSRRCRARSRRAPRSRPPTRSARGCRAATARAPP